MPKEITHLTIADHVLDRLTGTELGACLTKNLSYYRYGAVLPDTPFYAPGTPTGDQIISKGMAVHGKPPGNTMAPYLRLAAVYDASGNDTVLALTCGALVHMITDSIFHPAVLYYSGQDLFRHYRFETLLDCHFFMNLPKGYTVKVRDILASIMTSDESLSTWVSTFFDISPDQHMDVKKTIWRHGHLQSLFFSRIAGYGYHLITRLKRHGHKHNTALFYPRGLRIRSRFFSSSFFYRHPVTGQEHTTDITALSEAVIDKAIALLSVIDPSAPGQSLEALLAPIQPVSLETGLNAFQPWEHNHKDTRLPIDTLILG